MKKITYAQAGIETIREEMLKDKRVFYLGEDVGPFGGPFGTTKGLWEEFGDERVKDLSEGDFTKLIIINGRAVFRKCDLEFINALKKEDDCVAYTKNGILLAAILPSKAIKRFSEEMLLLSHEGPPKK